MDANGIRSWHLFRQALGTVFLLFCFQAALFGQSVSSAIAGRLTDPEGKVVAGAAIRVVNVNSGVSFSATSNEVGLYRISPLQPGNYRVEVEAQGFQRLAHADITVQVSQVVELDLALQVGNVSETVNVTGAAPVVEAQSSSVGQLVDRNMIEGMPLPNRAATALVVLSPGAAVISQGSGGENIPIFSVAGGRVRNQNYSLDGGNVTNVVGLAVPQQQTSLPMDAMQEFRIISNNYAAEHGHSTGGIVTLSTRSGGNQYHGSVFEYFRNDKLDARNFFAATRPRLRYNHFLWYAPMMPHTPHTPPERLLMRYQAMKLPPLIAKYYAMVEWFDETVGQLLDHLEKKGLAQNTLALYVSDNGWVQTAEQKPLFDARAKLSPYDAGLRTPIIVKWPAKLKPRRDDATLASSIDLAPTVFAACGIKTGANLPGINLLDTRRLAARKAVYGSTFAHTIVALNDPASSLKYRWVAGDRWKLIVPYRPNLELPIYTNQPASYWSAEDELYDLSTDPKEQNNLAKKRPELVESLMKELNRWWLVNK